MATGRTIEYTVTETGPQHAKQFTATVRLPARSLATGSGTSKKRAEQDAARRALELLNGRRRLTETAGRGSRVSCRQHLRLIVTPM